MSRVVQVWFGDKEFVGSTESTHEDASPFIVLREPAFVVRIPDGRGRVNIGITPIKKMADYGPQDLQIPKQHALMMELNHDGITHTTYRQAISGLHVPNGKQILQAANARRQ